MLHLYMVSSVQHPEAGQFSTALVLIDDKGTGASADVCKQAAKLAILDFADDVCWNVQFADELGITLLGEGLSSGCLAVIPHARSKAGKLETAILMFEEGRGDG